MTVRPRRGDQPLDSLQAALAYLAEGEGPNISKLLHSSSNGCTELLRLVAAPVDWRREEVAEAVLDLIATAVTDIDQRSWRLAVEAALRLPDTRYQGAAFDSRAKRWQEAALELPDLAGKAPAKREEALRGYWRSSLPHLATAVRRRIDQQNRAGWVRNGVPYPPAPPLDLPISFALTEILYEFDGFRGVQSTSRRLLRAHGAVDHYEAVGWYYAEPDAKVEIVPIYGCVSGGQHQDLPVGGRSLVLRFDKTLEPGDEHYFEYKTVFNSQLRCRPTILYEVRGQSMDKLIVRARFDSRVLPVKIWPFDVAVQTAGQRVPEDGAPELLAVSSNGYVEREFGPCFRGRKYGLRWIWPIEET